MAVEVIRPIIYLSLLVLLSPATAQSNSNASPPNSQYPYANFTPSMAIIIVVLIAALFLMGFFSIYLRHCTDSTVAGSSVRPLGGIRDSLRRRNAARGLDVAVIETFPTFEYSTVKGMKIGKGALECAVCLNEFEDDDTLRLIPKCDHVFHPDCIDLWLGSHVTCPVCRANLVPQPGETIEVPEFRAENSDEQDGFPNPRNDDVSIRVGEGEEDERDDDGGAITPPPVMDRSKSVNQNRPPRTRSFHFRSKMFGKFPRSYSTGHSLVSPRDNTDRFTLRLPEDVRKQVMKSRALDRTTSCVVVLPSDQGSGSQRYRPRLGEGSSRGPTSFRRLDQGMKSGRSDRLVFSMAPPFFSRSSSTIRSPKVMGDGSTSSRRTVVKLPSFKCLEPKGDHEPGLISAEMARLPV